MVIVGHVQPLVLCVIVSVQRFVVFIPLDLFTLQPLTYLECMIQEIK